MKITKYLTLMAAALAMGACSNDDAADGVDLTKPISLNLTAGEPEAQTRATIGTGSNTFASGDKVGVYVSAGTLSEADYANTEYTYGGSTWTANPDMYWPSGTETYTLTAYYPFSGTAGTAATSLAVSIPADQSTASAYTGADYLWGQKSGQEPTNSAITLTLNHRMSLLKLTMQAGDGIGLDEVKAMTPALLGTIPAAGTWDLTTGSITATTGEGTMTHTSITPYADTSNGLAYYALVMPGTTFSTNSKLLTLEATDGTTFSYTLNIDEGISTTAGTYCELTLTVNRTGIELSSFTIGNWTEGSTGSGSVTME